MAKRVNEPAAPALRMVALSAKWKLFVSLLLILHLLAVVAEPFSMFTRGANGAPSPAALPLRRSLAPYIEFGYLHHGYFFFAPIPAESHVLECTLKSSNGAQSRLRLPDRRVQWPRLLYHRHFMLAEFLHQLHAAPLTEQDIATIPSKEIVEELRAARSRFEMVRDSMINHLKHRYNIDMAEISRLEHRLPSTFEVFDEKIPLNDERLYIALPDGPVAIPPVGPLPELIPGNTQGGKPILNSKVDATEPVAAEPVAAEKGHP